MLDVLLSLLFIFVAGDSEVEEDDVMYSGDEGETARGKAKKRKARWAPNAPTTVNVYGIEFAKLLELCLSKLLVGSDGALRTHLVELKVMVQLFMLHPACIGGPACHILCSDIAGSRACAHSPKSGGQTRAAVLAFG